MPVRAADDELPSVLGVPVISGRWLNALGHTTPHCARSCSGEGIAKQYGYLPGEIRTIRLNGTNFGVVGVLGSVALDPTLDNAAFVTQWAAQNIFHTNGQPNQLYIRSGQTARPRPRRTRSRPPSTSAVPSRRRPRSRVTCCRPSPGQQDPAAGRPPRRAPGAHRRRDRHRQRDVDLGHPAVVRDRDPPCRRPQPVEDRRPVPPRVALRRRARRAGRRRAGGGVVYAVSALADWVVVIDYAPDTDLDGPGTAGVDHRRPLPVDQGGPARAARDAPPGLSGLLTPSGRICPAGGAWGTATGRFRFVPSGWSSRRRCSGTTGACGPRRSPVAYLNDSSVHEQMVRFATDPTPSRSPAPDQLVPLPRPRVAAVPPLPEPALDPHRAGRDRHRPRPGVLLEPVPPALAVAGQRLPGGPGASAGAGGPRPGRGCCRRSSSARSASGSRPRPTCGSASACGPSCGRCDPAPGLGLLLAGRSARDGGTGRHRLRLAHGDAPLRDRVPGLDSRLPCSRCSHRPLVGGSNRPGAGRAGRHASSPPPG